jgi:hypothetical protein
MGVQPAGAAASPGDIYLLPRPLMHVKWRRNNNTLLRPIAVQRKKQNTIRNLCFLGLSNCDLLFAHGHFNGFYF